MNMCFCGTDIIDIYDSFNIKSFSNPAYLEKVFHPSELEFIHTVNDAMNRAFLLWVCKEATYKMCFKRSDKGFTFVPKQFLVTKDVSPDKQNLYSVSFQNKTYKNTVISTNQYILAFCGGNSGLHSNEYTFDYGVLFDESANAINCSEKIRESVKKKLINTYPDIKMANKNINGFSLPSLYSPKYIEGYFDISISHDGNWLAYSYINKIV
jgi:phosphopantetheinyl transferase (holo-ACP synthase)